MCKERKELEAKQQEALKDLEAKEKALEAKEEALKDLEAKEEADRDGMPPLVGSSEEDDEDEATADMCPFGGHKSDLCLHYRGAWEIWDECMPCTDERCGPFAAHPFFGYQQHHCINACPH